MGVAYLAYYFLASVAGIFFAANANITNDKPLKIMSIPTKRPITHNPEKGHSCQMATPNHRLI